MDSNQSRIIFYDSPKELLASDMLIEALHRISKMHNYLHVSLVYNFVPREKIIEINTHYLAHKYATDIITFNYNEADLIKGEVFLCPDVIKENATDLGVDFVQELHRVVFHGLLHLIGFDDQNESDKKAMRNAENECLKLINL